MRHLTIAAALMLFLAFAAGHYLTARGENPMPKLEGPGRQVGIVLLGSAEDLVGIDVPPGLSKRRTEYLRVDQPSDVTLSLPTGLRAQLPVKYLSLAAQYGTVTDVNLLPLKKSVPFKDAVR